MLSTLHIILIFTIAFDIKIAILQMLKLKFRDKITCLGFYSEGVAEPGIGLGQFDSTNKCS